MSNGFQTWKDILEVFVIPVGLAVLAYLYPWIQSAYRHRRFLKLIVRELREINPHPKRVQPEKQWWEHQGKEFIHKRIFESPSENRDFILSLPPDVVYNVSQLWDALRIHNETQWLHFLQEIVKTLPDETGEIRAAYQEWLFLLQGDHKAERDSTDQPVSSNLL